MLTWQYCGRCYCDSHLTDGQPEPHGLSNLPNILVGKWRDGDSRQLKHMASKIYRIHAIVLKRHKIKWDKRG